MRRVIWSPGASSDLAEILDYVSQFNPLAAQRLALQLAAVAESLETISERGRVVRPGVRQLAVVRPYLIRYEVTADNVTILRLRHGARLQD